MKSNSRPSMRYIAERLMAISRELQRDYYTNNKLSRADKFYLSSLILELRQHCVSINSYAPYVPIEDNTYPRTPEDVYEVQSFPF